MRFLNLNSYFFCYSQNLGFLRNMKFLLKVIPNSLIIVVLTQNLCLLQQTNKSDMLDLAVEYVKGLQKQVKVMKLKAQ